MNLHKPTLLFLLCLISLLPFSSALAGPGAHGPNGEHLDSPHGGQAQRSAIPRLETFTETFELVAHLNADELSILIDRYDSNEPVLNGKLEVELKGIKAQASFHADHGDYAVTDAKLLQALAKPGKHALLFTISAGNDNDLLEATLDVSAHGHHPSEHAAGWHVLSSMRSTGLSLGAMAAIAVIAMFAVVGVVLMLVFFCKRRRNQLNRNPA